LRARAESVRVLGRSTLILVFVRVPRVRWAAVGAVSARWVDLRNTANSFKSIRTAIPREDKLGGG